MKTAILKIEVPNNFEAGDCMFCPLENIESYCEKINGELIDYCVDECVLKCESDKCPLIIKNKIE